MTATIQHDESFGRRLLAGFVAFTVVVNRLWLSLIAVPAGLVLTVMLMANDYSPTKVVESVLVFGHERIQGLQPGSVAGTYRWAECIDAKPSIEKIALPNAQCNHLVSREGSLIQAINGTVFLGNVYFFILLCFAVQLYAWPSSRFLIRSKLARLFRLNHS